MQVTTKKWRKRKKREKEYERDMTESLRLLRVSRAPAGDLIVAIRKRSVKSVRHTNRTNPIQLLANLNSSKQETFNIQIFFAN
jgi:hypothetical protein